MIKPGTKNLEAVFTQKTLDSEDEKCMGEVSIYTEDGISN
jgi:hypothetical protein